MVEKNIQMAQRNQDNTGWDNLFPITLIGNIIGTTPDVTVSDVNLINESGFSKAKGVANLPSNDTTGDWAIFTYKTSEKSAVQYAHALSGLYENRMFVRTKYTDIWTSWGEQMSFQFLRDRGNIVEEYGVTSTGVYVRFANGVQICYRRETIINQNITKDTRFTRNFVFPKPFLNMSNLSVQGFTSFRDEGGNAFHTTIDNWDTGNQTNVTVIARHSGQNEWSPFSVASGVAKSVTMSYIAIGPWKS